MNHASGSPISLNHRARALASVTLRSPGGRSQVTATPQGAQVLSWVLDGAERLYLSPLAKFCSGKAIRGGIPVIFPQFGTRGPGLRHGFARLRRWRTAEANPARLLFELADDNDTRRTWPSPFAAFLEVDLPAENTLRVALSIRNTGGTAATFTVALHSYLRVQDITTTVRLLGLRGRMYEDATLGGVHRRDRAAHIGFEGEVDRVYLEAPARIRLLDGGDRLEIAQSGFRDTVVWNPGAAVASRMDDLEAGAYRHFVCVEAACVQTPVRLVPGEEWRGEQTLMG